VNVKEFDWENEFNHQMWMILRIGMNLLDKEKWFDKLNCLKRGYVNEGKIDMIPESLSEICPKWKFWLMKSYSIIGVGGSLKSKVTSVEKCWDVQIAENVVIPLDPNYIKLNYSTS
jgi:hypothetical protein